MSVPDQPTWGWFGLIFENKINLQAYGKYAQGTGSMIDMLEKEPLSTKADTSRERNPENYQLRYFTEMEVAGLMGFPKHFSFPSELTTRQVKKNLKENLQVYEQT